MTTSFVSATARVARVIGDAVRVATLLSAVVVVVWLHGDGVPFVILFLILLPPRLMQIAAPFDAAVAEWGRPGGSPWL